MSSSSNGGEGAPLIEATAQDIGFWHRAYRAHGGAVLGYLRGRLGRRHDAEDLLQETFVRAMRASSFRAGSDATLRAYLMSTARNLVINQLRRPRLVVSGEGDDGALFDTVSDREASPEQRAALRAFEARLEVILAGLSEAHRQAFQLAIVEQRPYREIAAHTGWSLAQVKINVYRARKRVIDELGDVLPTAGWRKA